MTMKYSPAKLIEEAIELGWEGQLEINPMTGNRRLVSAHNDVMGVVEVMGGTPKAAEALGVEEIEVETWTDQHYVPTRYAKRINQRTGWSIWSMQRPPFDVTASVGVQ